MKLLFCGDIMPGGVLPYQEKYVQDDVLKYLKSFDLRIGTLECAVGNDLAFEESKMNAEMNIIYARKEDFFRIKELGIDIVSLANNHIYDLGEAGLVNTIALLKDNNIKYVGAGMNIEEASSPLIIEKDGLSIAIFACCFQGLKPVWVTAATENGSGIWQSDINTVCKAIVNAKHKYDYVVVMPHWGIELKYFPPKEYYDYAGRMIDAGADYVLGSHTHILGPLWKYKKKTICYSMGNFLFPDFCMMVPKPQFYPADVQEYKSLERRWFYPKNFEKPVVSVWRGRNRIGSMVSLTIKRTKSSVGIDHVFLSEKNILSLYTGMKKQVLRLRMLAWNFLYSHFDYNFVNRVINSRFNFIGRKLNQSGFFNINIKL